MSSHHVVRDLQEPALIIANGASCRSEILNDLLEWSPFVVVLDGAIHRVLDLGIKIDALLGDFDRNEIDFEQVKFKQDSIEIVHTPDQNKTDLEKALDFLIDKGHQAVSILWATGRRADHTFSNIALLARYRGKIKITLLDDHSSIFLLPQRPASFQKWYPKGSIISLLPLGEVSGISTKNLKYNVSNADMKLGFIHGNSNEVAVDGIIEISHESGDLLLMECTD